MKRPLPLALLVLGLFSVITQAAETRASATGMEATQASLKAAQAETAKLESLRRSLSDWQINAGAAAKALRGLNLSARALAMAAMENEGRWQQARNDWRRSAADPLLAQQETRFRPATPDAGDKLLASAVSDLRERLAGARAAVANFDNADLTGKLEQKRLMLDQCQALLTTLSSAAQATDTLRALLDARLTNLDTQLLLLRSQSTALTQPTLPSPRGQKP
ncbi:MAG: hypothetical protein PHU46_18015 [Rhodocyclaceae bacterium]|nr:hypothetical protein [Rhodocyclaceae bacterium]